MSSNPQAQPFFAHPLAILAAAFILGILLVELFSVSALALFGLGVTAFSLSFASLISRRTRAAVGFLWIAYILAGATLYSVEKGNLRPDRLKLMLDAGAIASDPLELTGVLERQPEIAPEAVYLTLRVESLRTKGTEKYTTGNVTLLLPVAGKVAERDYQNLDLRYGARLRVVTVLKRANKYRNPGGSSFTQYLDRHGFDASGLIKSPLLIERLDDTRVFLPLAWLYDWRQQLQQQINARFRAETAGVLNASLLGNRHFLSHTAAEKFREGGTFHVLVISGLHISFIGGLVLLIARRASKNSVAQFVASATVLWSYALAVGAEASVVRAALMFTVVAFAPVVRRRNTSLNALGAAALVLLAWRPGDLFDPSFQLTFLSVLAIVVFAWPMLQRMSEIGSWRPTRETPYPPGSLRWLRTLSEVLFWQERNWRREKERLSYSYELFKSPLAVWLERHHLQPLLRYTFAAVLVSVCVQATLLPLLIVYFHRVSISALVLNIGVSLIMAVFVFTGIAAILITQVSTFLAVPLVGLTNALNWLMLHGVDPFARLGIASLRLPEYSGGRSAVYGLFYVPLAILAVGLAHWLPLKRPELSVRSRSGTAVRIAVVTQIVIVAIVILHPLGVSATDGKLRIDFLDVGQGDAALVTMPDGTTLLVDAGGQQKFSAKKPEVDEEKFAKDVRGVGEAVVSEYLWWRGLDHVDYLLATHADADHIGGLNDVARNFQVRSALVARTPANDPEYAEFAATLNDQGIPVTLIGADDQLEFGKTKARVLWPPPSRSVQAQSFNDDSIVLRLELGKLSILLLGDIESDGEAALLEGLKRNHLESELRVEVVKVAHHGSRTSSIESFVDAARPKLAVISVGRDSMFGHPHAPVVERWRSIGAEILTTGQRGTITVTTDGQDLQVMKFVQ
ncbi:MAG: ComEC/Rec2 family competence protein [Pyrinomonadaceae bacterium]